jgi:Ni/Co efflux regulator RcnB
MEWTMRTILAALAAAFLALPLAGAAQSAPKADAPGAKVEYEKKTVINFEDDTIEGDLKRPDGEYVESRRKVDHSNLIKIREEWRDKVMQASGDL